MTTYHVKIIRCDADKTQEACSNTRRRPDGQRLRVDNLEAIQWGRLRQCHRGESLGKAANDDHSLFGDTRIFARQFVKGWN